MRPAAGEHEKIAGRAGRWRCMCGQSINVDMRPADIQSIGNELAIKWDDGSESFVPLEKLRRCCPCAGCKGETDIMGNLYRNPDKPLSPAAFQLMRLVQVGGYAVQPVWADGHSTGLYSFDYLRKVADSK
jgi:DUF971 family protein